MAKPKTVEEALGRFDDPAVQKVNFFVSQAFVWPVLRAATSLDDLVEKLTAFHAPPELIQMIVGDDKVIV